MSAAAADEPFVCLFLRVATTLALVCCAVGSVYQRLFPVAPPPVLSLEDDDDTGANNVPNLVLYLERVEAAKPRIVDTPLLHATEDREEVNEMLLPETIPPLPVWNLTEYSLNFDAYAIAEKYDTSSQDPDHNNAHLFWQAAAGLRETFAETYGGVNAARAMLERGTTVFGTNGDSHHRTSIPVDLQVTACRILRAKSEQRPFRFAFGGYSVTAGRGNLFQQSFPFVMEQQLHTVFKLLGVELTVRNAAM
jgi:hypothetical protein